MGRDNDRTNKRLRDIRTRSHRSRVTDSRQTAVGFTRYTGHTDEGESAGDRTHCIARSYIAHHRAPSNGMQQPRRKLTAARACAHASGVQMCKRAYTGARAPMSPTATQRIQLQVRQRYQSGMQSNCSPQVPEPPDWEITPRARARPYASLTAPLMSASDPRSPHARLVRAPQPPKQT